MSPQKNPPVKLPNEPAITPQIVAEHGLSPEEYQRVLAIMGRTPTMVELGIFSAMRTLRPRDGDGQLLSQGSPSPGDSLQLGYVWKAQLITDIARGFNRAEWEERIWKNRR